MEEFIKSDSLVSTLSLILKTVIYACRNIFWLFKLKVTRKRNIFRSWIAEKFNYAPLKIRIYCKSTFLKLCAYGGTTRRNCNFNIGQSWSTINLELSKNLTVLLYISGENRGGTIFQFKIIVKGYTPL